MIFLYTDFGTKDPYVGQVHAAIRRRSSVPVVDLLHHVPVYDIRAGAYLLDALQRQCDTGDVLMCVVDPGVGGNRAPVMMQADGKWYVGPDNGLLNIVARRAGNVEVFRIDWRPEKLSASFHGRDLFAPVAASLSEGRRLACSSWNLVSIDAWPEELAEIIYVDHYGNAVTGVRADSLSRDAVVRVKNRNLRFAETFSGGRQGQPFWYRNSLGLVEIALRENSAEEALGLKLGDNVELVDVATLLR